MFEKTNPPYTKQIPTEQVRKLLRFVSDRMDPYYKVNIDRANPMIAVGEYNVCSLVGLISDMM